MANIPTVTPKLGSTSVPQEAPIDLAPPKSVLRRLGLGFWLSVGWLALVVLVAILAPLLTLDPGEARANPDRSIFTLPHPDDTAVGGRGGWTCIDR